MGSITPWTRHGTLGKMVNKPVQQDDSAAQSLHDGVILWVQEVGVKPKMGINIDIGPLRGYLGRPPL